MSSATDNPSPLVINSGGASAILGEHQVSQTLEQIIEPPLIPHASHSNRTSMTRADLDEDSRPRQSVSHEPATIPTAHISSAQQTAVNITSSVPHPTFVVQEQPQHLSSAQHSMSNSPAAEIYTSEQHVDTTEPVPQTPLTYVTFLLISGRRRTMAFNPETTIGRLKELVWNSWPGGTVIC